MAWLLLTSAHIATALTGPEITAAQSAVLVAGQAAPMPDVITQVSRYVRARVGACAKNTLGEGDTIPDELLASAIDLAVYRLAKRLPGKILAKQERVDAATAAESLLQDVAACRLALAQPATSSSETVASTPAPRFTVRPRQFSRSQQDGT
ncbi:MAG: DUF1320 family protein [Opitutaceae bacterium]|nr:DUF1320 family protein [Opitutaceae bacterium]